MLEWKEAAPIIGVIITMFGGLIGMFIANMLSKRVTVAAATVPAVVAAASLTKEGTDQKLTLAVEGLAEVLTSHYIVWSKACREREEARRDQHDEHMNELRKLRQAWREYLEGHKA